MLFSERMGLKPVRNKIQLESMDEELRISLWNVLHLNCLSHVQTGRISSSSWSGFFLELWASFLKLPLDTLDDRFVEVLYTIREKFFSWKWYEVYDFIEVVPKLESPIDVKKFRVACNSVLEREMSAYRFVGEHLSPITDATQLSEVEEAMKAAEFPSLGGAAAHLDAALAKLADRKKPDYRNSIKESISAVESVCRVISDDPKAELGKALKTLDSVVELHPALKGGFLKMYGYTSDEGGIRHAMLDQSNCDFEDAKYMLVACSAFVNYLIMKAQKSGILTAG
jgi:hypothetical protein